MQAHRAAVVLATVCSLLGVLGAQQSERQAFLEEYLEKFPWGQANSTPSDAMLLRIIVESRGAQRGVEVGTNTGFGALNMGMGFERTGGRLTTIEINPRAAEAARQHVQKAGLDKVVTVIQGDALKVLPTLEGPFDFVYLDALKPDYLKYLKLLEPKLKPGATIVADNAIDYAKQMADFLEYIESSPLYDTAVVRTYKQSSATQVEGRSHGNDGMLVGYKIR